MRRRERGVSLIETIIAMGILVTGAMGLISLNNLAVRWNADGRRMTRATAIAQDLAQQIQLWDYTDARLTNKNPANDADYADSAAKFETASFVADHDENDLGGANWLGIPKAELAGTGYERYWNVAEVDDENHNGAWDARRIAVIVRWPQGSGYRRIVLLLVKPNPADRL